MWKVHAEERGAEGLKATVWGWRGQEAPGAAGGENPNAIAASVLENPGDAGTPGGKELVCVGRSLAWW